MPIKNSPMYNLNRDNAEDIASAISRSVYPLQHLGNVLRNEQEKLDTATSDKPYDWLAAERLLRAMHRRLREQRERDWQNNQRAMQRTEDKLTRSVKA